MAVTDEQRREARDLDCAELGHILTFDNALRLDGRAGRVAGPDGKQPHIDCRRCMKVWLVIEEPGNDYPSAAAALDAKLLPEHRRPPLPAAALPRSP